MKKIVLFTWFLSSVLLTACSQQLPFPQRARKLGLEYVKDIPLPGGVSRFDYQSIDEVNRRLYIAHMGSDMVTVIAIDSLKVIKSISGISNVHGVLAVSARQRVYASATGKNEIAVIREDSLQIIATVPAGNYPDGLAYAPLQKRVFVSDEHGKTVSVIEASQNKLLKKIVIGGEVGNTHYDSISGFIFSADQTHNQLVAIDPQQMKIIKRYDLPSCGGAHGFYIDEQTNYAFITGEDNASIVVLDLSSGEIIAKGKVGRYPDVLAFDKQKKLLFVSSESGVVSVFKVKKNDIKKIAESFFYAGAHTISIDQKTHLIFFPLKNVKGKPVLRVMRIL
jgi:DNA-binding beta-propeller fold protein YncE